MLKFNFRRDKDKDFKHIAQGLIPAASIAPKPAVPRTPPPRSPDPSPERPRSALAAAILSSSLTGQTWAIPPTRTRSFSHSGQSESAVSEPNSSTAFYTRDRWSEDLASPPRLSSAEFSEEELEDKEDEAGDGDEDGADHVYQTLDRPDNVSAAQAIYALPLKPKTSVSEPNEMSGRRVPSADVFEESISQPPEIACESSRRSGSSLRNAGGCRETVPFSSKPPALASDRPSRSRRKVTKASSERNPRTEDEQRLLEERLRRLEQEISLSQASKLRSSADDQAELQNLRQHAQELVDENDALKLTVHRLNVELSRYQSRFRPLTKEEKSRISGLPETGSPPPPWLLDMKYLSPLLLAYDDRMNEKDALLQTTEEEMKKLRLRVEEVIQENERLRDDITKTGTETLNQQDCRQIQQQALLVLQENQVLIDQLEAQHVKAKANHSRHHSEVSKVSKQVMLLEVEKQHLEEDLEQSRREAQKNLKEVQVLQARLKDSVTWDEHCDITGKLRRQLEQQKNRTKSELDELLLRLSSLQEENRSLAQGKANLSADVKRLEVELELTKQTNRKTERRMSALKRQKDECVLTEEETRHYMEAVVSVVEHVSRERDQLLQMASLLQQEKQGLVEKIVNGTVRFSKLQEDVKGSRRRAAGGVASSDQGEPADERKSSGLNAPQMDRWGPHVHPASAKKLGTAHPQSTSKPRAPGTQSRLQHVLR
ncbi:uncharacterized protein V6R79_010793 [Siganus canaliculatus]